MTLMKSSRPVTRRTNIAIRPTKNVGSGIGPYFNRFFSLKPPMTVRKRGRRPNSSRTFQCGNSWGNLDGPNVNAGPPLGETISNHSEKNLREIRLSCHVSDPPPPRQCRRR
jgi:hypothetical protein